MNKSKEPYFYFVGGIFPVLDVDLLNQFKAYIQHTPIHVDFIATIEIQAPGAQTRIKTLNGQPVGNKILCWYVECYCLESEFKDFFALDKPYGNTKAIQNLLEIKTMEFAKNNFQVK